MTDNIYNYIKKLDENIKINDCKLTKEKLNEYHEIKLNNIKLTNDIFI